jgi:hypothetical protein
MKSIADLKKEILTAREGGDLELELNLLKELREADRPEVRTVKQAYAQLANSP